MTTRAILALLRAMVERFETYAVTSRAGAEDLPALADRLRDQASVWDEAADNLNRLIVRIQREEG